MSPSYSSQNNNVATEHNTIITHEVALVDHQNSNTQLTLEEQVDILREENQLLRLRMEYIENMMESICQQNTIEVENCDTDLYHDGSNNDSDTESDYDSMPELISENDDYNQNQYYINNNTQNLTNETNIIYPNSAVPYWIPN